MRRKSLESRVGQRQLRVRTLSPVARRGRVQIGPLSVPCALGRGGIVRRKREGDGGTPAGRWRLLAVFYRSDRVARPRTRLPTRPLQPHEGWCDDPACGRYNRPVRLPFPASHEKMWRDDELYDIVVVLDCNLRPRRRWGGSAIFFHIARPDFAPTEGCVAVDLPSMRRLLALAGPSALMKIG